MGTTTSPLKSYKKSHRTFPNPKKAAQTKPLITTEAGIAVRDHLKNPNTTIATNTFYYVSIMSQLILSLTT